MLKKLDKMFIKLMTKQNLLLKEERGDTNFISILILLAVAISLAVIFIGFKDNIVGQVQEIINGFTIS